MSKRSDYEGVWQQLLSQRGATQAPSRTQSQDPELRKDRVFKIIAGSLVVYLLLRAAYAHFGGALLPEPLGPQPADKTQEIAAPLSQEEAPTDHELAKVLVEERLKEHSWSRQSLMDIMCRFPATAVLTCEEVDAVLDEMDVDWKENALKSAQGYVASQHLSKSELYEQLTHPYGSAFTPEEADYAMQHLYVDWRQVALDAAKEWREHSTMNDEQLYNYLTNPRLGGFTEEEVQWAFEQLDNPWS